MSETTIDSAGQVETARTVKPPRRVPKSLIIGGAIVGMFLVLAIIGPYITPYPFDKFHFGSRLAPPSADFWWGTDRYGRDIFSRVIHGTSMTVFMAGTGTFIGVFFGLLIGLFSGYVGGWIDNVIMRIMDVILGFPAFLLAIAIVAVLGPGLRNALLAIAIVTLPAYARVMRASVLSIKELDYVAASRALGASGTRILLVRVLPNAMTPVVVLATLGVAGAILDAAGLSFLGLGAQPPIPEWGSMLGSERNQVFSAPHLVFFPGIAIMITVLGFNLLGDGMRDALDPRLND